MQEESGPSSHISIIVTHYADPQYPGRSEMMKDSLKSLIKTTAHLPVEIIVVHNGSSIVDSDYFTRLVRDGKINILVENKDNMHWSFGWDQGYKLATGDTLVFTMNDIEFKDGWLDECLSLLDKYKLRRFAAAPMAGAHNTGKNGENKFDDARVSARAGSNCLVIRRRDYEYLGRFLYHPDAGTWWYWDIEPYGFQVILPKEDMVKDLGFRIGYNHLTGIKRPKIGKTLANGERVIFEEKHPDENYRAVH